MRNMNRPFLRVIAAGTAAALGATAGYAASERSVTNCLATPLDTDASTVYPGVTPSQELIIGPISPLPKGVVGLVIAFQNYNKDGDPVSRDYDSDPVTAAQLASHHDGIGLKVGTGDVRFSAAYAVASGDPGHFSVSPDISFGKDAMQWQGPYQKVDLPIWSAPQYTATCDGPSLPPSS